MDWKVIFIDLIKSLLDTEIAYDKYKQMDEKLPKRSNMLEATKSIMDNCNNGVQAEVPTCNKAVQINKPRNDYNILFILSVVCCILRIIIAVYILYK